jgi:hypothetical protein
MKTVKSKFQLYTARNQEGVVEEKWENQVDGM